MADHKRVAYVTADSSEWMVLESPDGLISPPIIELHRPQVGAIKFYYASCYELRVPKEAKADL